MASRSTEWQNLSKWPNVSKWPNLSKCNSLSWRNYECFDTDQRCRKRKGDKGSCPLTFSRGGGEQEVLSSTSRVLPDNRFHMTSNSLPCIKSKAILEEPRGELKFDSESQYHYILFYKISVNCFGVVLQGTLHGVALAFVPLRFRHPTYGSRVAYLHPV